MTDPHPIPSNLRECISEELTELANYGAKQATLVLHPRTFAALDNRIPGAPLKCGVRLDSGMKVGYFTVN